MVEIHCSDPSTISKFKTKFENIALEICTSIKEDSTSNIHYITTHICAYMQETADSIIDLINKNITQNANNTEITPPNKTYLESK